MVRCEKRSASAEAKVKQEELHSDYDGHDEAVESDDTIQTVGKRGRSRERRKSPPKTKDSTRASSSGKAPENHQEVYPWGLLDMVMEPAVPVAMEEEQSPPEYPEGWDDWDPITAEEEQATVDTTPDDVMKNKETSSLDAELVGLNLSSTASQAAPTESESGAVPAGTVGAGERAQLSARSDGSRVSSYASIVD